MDLNTILFALLAVMLTGYTILDGFDLGVGVLSLFALSKEERDLHVASISPVWDGNQVWLLATGNVLFGAFPAVFAAVLGGLYLAFILFLAAFVARAVSIEFRLMHASSRWIRFWDRAFGIGCLFSAVLFGAAIGNVLRGLPIGPEFSLMGSILGVVNPYALLIGGLSCALFVMHGALYLWMKTEGEPAARQRELALRACCVFFLLYSAAVAATLSVAPFLFRKAGSPVFLGTSLLLAVALASIPLAIRSGRKGAAFIASSSTIALIVMGTAFSSHPVLVPSLLDPRHSLSLHNAASTHGTLLAMLAIGAAGMPIMLGYTFAVYRVFRGPVRPEPTEAGERPSGLGYQNR